MYSIVGLFVFALATIALGFVRTESLQYQDLSNKIKGENYVPIADDVEVCILNNWWDLAADIVLTSHKQGQCISFL
ncbi:hypothetical protein BdWA1_001935 [Babesia duncani]|uniref:Uncharacterized protein n=1 Tax=Babesia duncani TaxID=323732 RepID=A0AAD9PLE3_9APIC|nr:hypothetical protein BdWA1_001935 [Babesia duncani]